MKTRIGPKLASLLLVVFILLIVAVTVFGLSTSGAPVLPVNVVAAAATVLGLILQALSDFIPRWMAEDARQEGKRYREPGWIANLRIIGHALVIVGAAYFLATYLVPVS